MSRLFFDRMRVELFNLFMEALHLRIQQELDAEVERISGKECDDAAKTLSKDDFRRVAEEAMRNIKKRRQRKADDSKEGQKPMVAYA